MAPRATPIFSSTVRCGQARAWPLWHASTVASPLIRVTPDGLYCDAGGFHVDPWRPVDLAVVTHAHADHARPGMGRYLAARSSAEVLRRRLGEDARVDTITFGERRKLGSTWVSFHPAAHVLGSAQIRVERGDDVWVVSGDYKRQPDPTCEAFELVPCTTFVTEATFGLPVYAWRDPAEVLSDVLAWWESDSDRPSLLFCYAFGKAQRVLAELARITDRRVWLHGAVDALMPAYRGQGIEMVPTGYVGDAPDDHDFRGDLVLAPPSAHRSPWMKRFRAPQTGFASGWMHVRGNRRRRGYETGFVLSDHADWPALVNTVLATGAQRVYVTHGHNDVFARYLREVHGLDAEPLETLYEGDAET